MPNTIRVRRNGAIKPDSTQTKTSRRKPENGPIVITVKAVDLIEEAESVLKELEQIGLAASAAAMMNATELEADGREFSAGQRDLARLASREFKNEFAALTGSVAVSLTSLRATRDGTALPPNPFGKTGLLLPWSSIENTLEGLSHLLNLQDYTFGQLGIFDTGGLTFTVCKRLEAVNEALDGLYSKLSEAMKAIYSCVNQPERMAA